MKIEELKHIGIRIKELRGKISQEQCAKDLGISRGALSFYENGDRKPDANVIVKMCNYFCVSSDYLLGLSDVSKPDTRLQVACSKKKYTIEDVKSSVIAELKESAWETPVEELAHYVRVYTQLIDRLENTEETEGSGNE